MRNTKKHTSRKIRLGDIQSSPRLGEGNYTLPRVEPPIERLPILGTTWQQRGVSYWSRRFLIFLAVLVGAASETLFAWSLLNVIARDESKTILFRIIILTIITIVSLSGFVYWLRGFLRIENRKRRGELAYPRYGPQAAAKAREAGFVGGTVGSMARTGNSAAGVFLVVAAVVALGAFPFLIIHTLQWEYVYEHDARLRLERWKRYHRQRHESDPSPVSPAAVNAETARDHPSSCPADPPQV